MRLVRTALRQMAAMAVMALFRCFFRISVMSAANAKMAKDEMTEIMKNAIFYEGAKVRTFSFSAKKKIGLQSIKTITRKRR